MRHNPLAGGTSLKDVPSGKLGSGMLLVDSELRSLKDFSSPEAQRAARRRVLPR